MSLDFSVTDVEDYENVCHVIAGNGDKQWHPITNAIVWLSLGCGFSVIKESNLDDIATRVYIWENLTNTQLIDADTKQPANVTKDMLRQHIGLRTNVSPMSRTEFLKKVWRIAEGKV